MLTDGKTKPRLERWKQLVAEIEIAEEWEQVVLLAKLLLDELNLMQAKERLKPS